MHTIAAIFGFGLVGIAGALIFSARARADARALIGRIRDRIRGA